MLISILCALAVLVLIIWAVSTIGTIILLTSKTAKMIWRMTDRLETIRAYTVGPFLILGFITILTATMLISITET